VKLAGHLLEISHTPVGVYGTQAVEGHVVNALESLRDTLGERWHVQHRVEGTVRPVAFSGMQIEELTLNLCLQIAEQQSQPGHIGVCIAGPRPDKAESQYAGRIVISYAQDPATLSIEPRGEDVADENTGVIVSVVRSLLESSGGALKCGRAPEGGDVYCLYLPLGGATGTDISQVPAELKAYVAPWSILFAATPRDPCALHGQLRSLGLNVRRVEDIAGLLAHLSDAPRLDAMILHEKILGPEQEGLLRAILKIRPSAGIVVLCADPAQAPPVLSENAVFLGLNTAMAGTLLGLIDAKTLAVKRTRGA
jgi:hypothetical protein